MHPIAAFSVVFIAASHRVDDEHNPTRREYMRKRSLLLLTGLIALVGSLVIGPAATATTEGASAGTVVIVHDQEPGILNNFLSEGNGYTVSLVMNTILAGGLIYNDKVKLKP